MGPRADRSERAEGGDSSCCHLPIQITDDHSWHSAGARLRRDGEPRDALQAPRGLRGAGDQPAEPAAQRRGAVSLALVDDRLRGRRGRLGPPRGRDGGRAALAGPGRDRRRAGADRLSRRPATSATASAAASGSASASPPPASRSSRSPCRTRRRTRATRSPPWPPSRRSRSAPGCALFASGVLRRGTICHGVVLGLASGLLIGVSNVAIKALTEAIDGRRRDRARQPVDRARRRRRHRRLLRPRPRDAARRGDPGDRDRLGRRPTAPRSSAASSSSATRSAPASSRASPAGSRSPP